MSCSDACFVFRIFFLVFIFHHVLHFLLKARSIAMVKGTVGDRLSVWGLASKEATSTILTKAAMPEAKIVPKCLCFGLFLQFSQRLLKYVLKQPIQLQGFYPGFPVTFFFHLPISLIWGAAVCSMTSVLWRVSEEWLAFSLCSYFLIVRMRVILLSSLWTRIKALPRTLKNKKQNLIPRLVKRQYWGNLRNI